MIVRPVDVIVCLGGEQFNGSRGRATPRRWPTTATWRRSSLPNPAADRHLAEEIERVVTETERLSGS
jgi:hypothetical protein